MITRDGNPPSPLTEIAVRLGLNAADLQRFRASIIRPVELTPERLPGHDEFLKTDNKTV